jgi:hypothetical protein
MRTSTNTAPSLFTQVTFAEIDRNVSHLLSPENAELITAGSDPMSRLVTVYKSVRPMLLVIMSLPLIPPAWRSALKLFVTNIDGLATAFDPTFKAGKDL